MDEPFQLPFGSREERIAYNEAWSRALNEKQAEWGGGESAMTGFRCECWKRDCDERLPLSASDWATARAEPNRFAVAPDHVAKNIEVVVTTHPEFWIVEKLGEAGRIAKDLST